MRGGEEGRRQGSVRKARSGLLLQKCDVKCCSSRTGGRGCRNRGRAACDRAATQAGWGAGASRNAGGSAQRLEPTQADADACQLAGAVSRREPTRSLGTQLCAQVRGGVGERLRRCCVVVIVAHGEVEQSASGCVWHASGHLAARVALPPEHPTGAGAQCLPRIRPGPWAVLQVSCVVRGRVRGETATLFSKVPVGALRRCLSAKLGDGQGCGSVKPQTDLQAQSPAQIYPPPSWAP